MLKKLFNSVIISGCFFVVASCGSDEQQASPVMNVVVAEVKETKIPVESTFNATLAAKETVEVRAKISGYLTERLFKEGALVKEGDVIYRLDDRDLKASLDTAKANTIKAKSAWENDNRNANRYIPLAKTGAISIQERDTVVTKAKESHAFYQAAQAEEDKVAVNLGYATIISPITGYINRSSVEVGSFVEAGSVLMTTIYRIDPIRAEFSITDKEYSNAIQMRAKYGDQVDAATFRLEIGDERIPYEHEGILEMVDPIVDSRTNTMGVRAEFPNPEQKLRPGLYVNVIGQLGERNALTVPDVAVRDSGGGKAVFIVDADSKLVSTPVEIGALVGEQRVITKGLSQGMKVIVEGLVTAQPGMTVNVIEKTVAVPAEGDTSQTVSAEDDAKQAVPAEAEDTSTMPETGGNQTMPAVDESIGETKNATSANGS